jgi:hypothetical protein
MKKYKIHWGGVDKYGSRYDGRVTIEGSTFEKAKEKFYQKMLEKGIRVGFVCQIEIIFD